MDAVINEQGQISVPQQLRDELGFGAGSVLELEAQNGALLVRRKASDDQFEKWRGRGVAPGGETSTDGYLKRIRDGHSS